MLLTAGLVVWAARQVDLERWRAPAAEAGDHLGQAVRAVAPEARAQLREVLDAVAPPETAQPEQSLEPELSAPPAEFGFEAPTPAGVGDAVAPAASPAAARGEPLTREETAQIRSRLDRVMTLARGPGR